MGTAAGVRMLGGSYNPMAESPIAMLVREFEWDYVAVRCQFVSVSCRCAHSLERMCIFA
jgi:hypothetical protein